MPADKVGNTGVWSGFGWRVPAWPTSFKSVDAFKAQVGRNGTLNVPLGKTVKIEFPSINPGSRVPEITNLNKRSPFEVKVTRENGKNYLEITTKANAKYGQTDNVKLYSGPLVAPQNESKFAFPFKLAVSFENPLILG